MAKYLGAKFLAEVLSDVLAGLSTATNAVITASDTVLSALGKLQAQVTALKAGATTITQTTSGQFFVQNGAVVNRINDRLFVGGATVNDGAFPNVSKDWLQTFLISSTGGSEVGPMISTTAAVLSNFGTFGLTAGSRTSDNPTASSDNTIGVGSFAINNNTTTQNNGWAYYGEGRKLSGVETTQTFGMELDVSNQGLLVTAHPYQQLPGGTVCLQLASGCGVALPGNNVTSCALQIVNNQTKFDRGIVFGSVSFNGTDGVTGSGVAIAMAKGHNLVWYNSTGNQTSQISGAVVTAANAIIQVFDDNGFHFKNQSGVDLFDVQTTPSCTNGMSFVAGITGAPVAMQAFGGDTNVGLNLFGKGTGTVNLNNTAVVFQTDTTNGSRIALAGDGATTPTKTLRAKAGSFDVLNNANTSILNITDAGAASVADLQVASTGLIAGAWTSTTGFVSAGSGTLGSGNTGTIRYKKIGRIVHLSVTISIGASGMGTGSGAIQITLPWNAAALSVITGRECSINGKALTGTINAGSPVIAVFNYDNSAPGANNVLLVLSGTIETST